MASFKAEPSGQTVTPGQKLKQGGEGSIHSVEGMPDVVAKIYLKQPETQKILKLQAMVGGANKELLKFAAWPQELLLDSTQQVRGFLMPRVDTSREDVHVLYSPKSRVAAFPDVDFRFLSRVATNVARAFATIHEAGHVIGDINHGHMLVGKDATVVLIDVDSFQIEINGTMFTCDVGAPLFTPPELQGKSSYVGLHRTPEHDAFGLGVILFHLLFMGRHPFGIKWDGPGDMPIPKAIKEGHFGYGSGSKAAHVHQPPGTLDLRTFGPYIATLFENSFDPNFAFASERPRARQWIPHLEGLESSLVKCSASTNHYYPKTAAPNCPWCSLEAQTRGTYFGQKVVRTPSIQPKVSQKPQVAKPKPKAAPTPAPTPVASGKSSWAGLGIFAGIAAVFALVVGITIANPPQPRLNGEGGGDPAPVWPSDIQNWAIDWWDNEAGESVEPGSTGPNIYRESYAVSTDRSAILSIMHHIGSGDNFFNIVGRPTEPLEEIESLRISFDRWVSSAALAVEDSWLNFEDRASQIRESSFLQSLSTRSQLNARFRSASCSVGSCLRDVIFNLTGSSQALAAMGVLRSASGSTSQNPTATRNTTPQNPTATRNTTPQNPTTTRNTTPQNPTTTRNTTPQNPTTTRNTTPQNPTTTRNTVSQFVGNSRTQYYFDTQTDCWAIEAVGISSNLRVSFRSAIEAQEAGFRPSVRCPPIPNDNPTLYASPSAPRTPLSRWMAQSGTRYYFSIDSPCARGVRGQLEYFETETEAVRAGHLPSLICPPGDVTASQQGTGLSPRARETFEELDEEIRQYEERRRGAEILDLSAAPTFTPFTVAPDIQNRAEVIRAMEREYPPRLRDAGIGGTVQVYFFIDEEGAVQQFLINESSGHQELDDAALDVAGVYRFSAALNRNEKVPVWVSFGITFQVR